MSNRYLEILDFTFFFEHFIFAPNADNVLEKELKRKISVSVGIELVVVDMLREVKQMFSDGHEIGIHGYIHESFWILGPQETVKSINKTREILSNLSIDDVSLVSPPYRSYDDEIIESIKNIGKNGSKDDISYSLILGEGDARDTDFTAEQAKGIAAICRGTKNECFAICYDTSLDSVNNIELLINDLSKHNFQFGTVTQLFENKGIELEDGKMYTRVKVPKE